MPRASSRSWSAVSSDPAIAVALTPVGREQARALGRELRGESIDARCDRAERTRQTGELALEGRDVLIAVVPELNDLRAGRFEGGPPRRVPRVVVGARLCR